ncbi:MULTISPECIES: heme lyase CcmF/NrfE family subunit [unclassified Undibacterium]|uniref:heme lyase CcmF/NrfE family subunit n=1 Tax=unclassified Undibacterium TaxID=2630295 RepID=UPI002AC8A509|nr:MULTISPECIES: heme lyase CcmF/NrfE family subunit [unclassified Undibacterium]MEB0140064.1 heme lyase CcmF/NrfE family subunit [Undibacterium sp. CCC2.1]MEB0173174.1 heme lyase CcmF/NrfE family subunit [Undibacterium sp. CCC1.1]MEB0176899.1 heme lyase CcmF/NrfE family subunit [Undibacterium sp. CCC3.4]MEB0216188.1 heme lyase CcmF/NrfE family subunit [Undibacterium sp. 5I2]WPX41946.1 heme lyase CcmF/NrfE family subunit [Undibacterium sp. CCC3.4]
MIPELGQFALALALALSLVAGSYGLWHISRRSQDEAYLSRAMAGSSILVFGLIAASFGALVASFVSSDFSVRNVAENSNILLPLQYKIAASWGSHEGSMLLWILMLAGWTGAVALFSQALAAGFRVRVLAILLLLQVTFLGFLLSSSNPFLRLLPAAAAGHDLNPLLQDPVMVSHPPLLYMGYVGFAVSFAFAIAALLEGRLDPTWARWSRPWANAAWSFLTIGILLGSWWAYSVLGWGGWWFWDPVENASLLPWLAGTALIHSLAVSDKRNALKSWTILLAMVAFALSLLGTFLVRSGVLTSVHAFATDPRRGILILGLLIVIIGCSFMLYAARTRQVGLGGQFAAVSRESMLLANNLLLVCALAAVLLGTLYPLIVEVLSGQKMSVGPPYFNAVFAPLLLPAVWLMALAPHSQWKAMPLLAAIKPMCLPLLVAIALTGAVIWSMGKGSLLMAIGLVAAITLALATLAHPLQQLRKLKDNGASRALFDRMRLLSLSYWGMIVAHCGIALFVAGVTMVKTYEIERDLVMQPGQTESIGPWRLSFIGVDQVPGPNYLAAHGVFELTRGEGKLIELVEPEKRQFNGAGQVITQAAISYGFFGDVYVSLGEASTTQEQAWSVRVYLKPCINWIWWGCALMALGGILTLFDRRYRRRPAAQHTEASA